MKTFIEKLQETEALKNKSIKEKGGYGQQDTPHLSEVLEYLKQYRTENNRLPEQTVYNRELEEYITEKENIPLNLQNILGTQVYFAQNDFRKEIEAEHKTKMLADGWLELTRETEYRGKIQLNAKKDGMMGTHKIDDTAKLIDSVISCNSEGEKKTAIFIVAKGKKSRGWYLDTLQEAFYKPIA